ncbi:probable serine/threonine-protein kinase PBL18, partial [Tanacetum coccineum]
VVDADDVSDLKMPVLPPKVSHSRCSPRIPKPFQALPPQPPNQVSELAFEMAAGLLMKSSQVRIMGANEDNEDSEKAIVMINLVPLGENFQNFIAYVASQILWPIQVSIKSSLFGDYEVLFVKCRGIPPLPPMPPSRNGNGGLYGHGNNGRDINPLGVDISKQTGIGAVVYRVPEMKAEEIMKICLRSLDSEDTTTIPQYSHLIVCVHHDIGLTLRSEEIGEAAEAWLVGLFALARDPIGNMIITFKKEKSLEDSLQSHILNLLHRNITLHTLKSCQEKWIRLVYNRDGYNKGNPNTIEAVTEMAVAVTKNLSPKVSIGGSKEGSRSSSVTYPLPPPPQHNSTYAQKLPSPIPGHDDEMIFSPHLKAFTFNELTYATRHFCDRYLLGEGGFGYVYKGWLNKETLTPVESGSGMAVAVKKLKPEGFQGGAQLLSWALRLKVAVEAARGLSFLHASELKIIYRDFKCFNVLLDMVCSSALDLTFHINIKGLRRLTTKCDVFSFGIVLLELITGRRAIDKNRIVEERKLLEWVRPQLSDRKRLFRIMDSKLEGKYSRRGAYIVANLALQCCHPIAKYRPHMCEVVSILEKIPSSSRTDSLNKMSSSKSQTDTNGSSPISPMAITRFTIDA